MSEARMTAAERDQANAVERAYRRGFSHAAFLAAKHLDIVGEVQDLTQWSNEVLDWRSRQDREPVKRQLSDWPKPPLPASKGAEK